MGFVIFFVVFFGRVLLWCGRDRLGVWWEERFSKNWKSYNEAK